MSGAPRGALILQPGTCPLCTVLTERERTTIAGMVSGIPAAAVLCLRHLALVLAPGPAPETERAMLKRLAAALRRDADDMRSYAL